MQHRSVVLGVVALVALGGCATDTDQTSSTVPTADTTIQPETTAVPETTLVDIAATDPAATDPTATDQDTAAASPPSRLEAPPDADGFATRLSSAHAMIVDTDAGADERAAAGVDYQLLLRSLADVPELDEAVLAAIDPSATPTVEPIVRARQFLQARSASRPASPLPDELPAWTVSEPEAVDVLLAHYAEAEALTGVPWQWLAAIHLQETRMGRIEGVSTAGAVGPMQFLPTTWESCCSGDPTVTRDAIIGAATYLAQSGGPDDMAAAVYQYNPNDGYVAVVTAYANSLRDEPELYTGYHAFQVFFASSAGTVRLPIGYSEPAPVNAAAYLADHPDDAT
jgi:membrane-bound lytic murein transglycosylase B